MSAAEWRRGPGVPCMPREQGNEVLRRSPAAHRTLRGGALRNLKLLQHAKVPELWSGVAFRCFGASVLRCFGASVDRRAGQDVTCGAAVPMEV